MSRIFTSITGLKLIVKARKSAVIFELEPSQTHKVSHKFRFHFTREDFKELLTYVEDSAHKSWTGLKPRETDSYGSDYTEYYDKELDNNGYLSITGSVLAIERPSLDSSRLYQFNKRKMEAFVYDIDNLLNSSK